MEVRRSLALAPVRIDLVTDKIIAGGAHLLTAVPRGRTAAIIAGGGTVELDAPAGSSGQAEISPSAPAYLMTGIAFGLDTLGSTFDTIPGMPEQTASGNAELVSLPPWWEPAPSGDLPPAPAGRGSAGQGGFPPGNPGRGRPRHRVVWGAAVAAVVLVAATAVVTDRLASGARHNGAVTTPTTAPVSASGPGSSSPTATASSGATPTGAASSGQAPPAPAPTATADAILSTGDVLISDDSGPQLDDNPPVGTVGPDADVTLGTGGTNQPQLVGNFGPSNGTLALWTGKAMPTRTQCMDLVLAQGQHQIPISARNVVCAETNHGRFAVLTILSITSESGALAQATVWTEQVPVPGN